jgi:hypothetical protein
MAVGDPSRRLTIAEFALLRHYGDAVNQAADTAARELAVEVVLAIALVHRKQGVSWNELASGFGVHPRTLRRWRMRSGPTRKPLPLPARTVAWPATLTPGQPAAGATANTIVFASGHPRPGGNEFSPEAAAVRARAEPCGVLVVEHGCVELGQIAALLAKHRPAVLHLAAHATFGGVVLALDSEPLVCPAAAVVEAVMQAGHRPALVVLNICDSFWDAQSLLASGVSAVAWAGKLEDRHAQVLSAQLYGGLAGGADLAGSFDRASITIRAVWPHLQRG